MLYNISTILLFGISISEFMRMQKLRKLVYPLIVIYFLIVIPIIGKFIHNGVIHVGFALLGFVITIIFIYKYSIITSKENSL